MNVNSHRWAYRVVLAISVLFSILSAKPYAQSWNDGTRLAMVQALVETNTFIIDDTIFVGELNRRNAARTSPYNPDDELLVKQGTKDKLYIGGHYFSDKSPVPGVVMAMFWKAFSAVGLPSIQENPGLFIYFLTVIFAGVPTVFCTWAILKISLQLGLDERLASLLALTFVFSIATPYAGSVNTHILALACVCGAFVLLTRDKITNLQSVILGLLMGFGYGTDLGTSPAFIVAFTLYVIFRHSFRVFIGYFLGVVPLILVHHFLNYQIGGTFMPANANPAYLNWPGSPFNESNMTGGFKHPSIEKLALYAGDLLFGKKGFLLHLPILLYASFASFRLLYRHVPEWKLILCCQLFALSTWTIYAVSSNNLSGLCLSIRWFIPLIAPGYVIAALSLREYRHHAKDVLILGIGQGILGIEGLYYSCWWGKLLPFYWPIVGITLTIWGCLNFVRLYRWVVRRFRKL